MSDDLISRSALLEQVHNERDIAHSKVQEYGGIFWIGVRSALNWCIAKLNEDPAVDAVPVVHGRWIKHDNGIGYLPSYECSVCGKLWNADMYFCGECGAIMDGENDKETERFRRTEEFKKVMRTAEIWKRRREKVEREHNFCNGARKENDNETD